MKRAAFINRIGNETPTVAYPGHRKYAVHKDYTAHCIVNRGSHSLRRAVGASAGRNRARDIEHAFAFGLDVLEGRPDPIMITIT